LTLLMAYSDNEVEKRMWYWSYKVWSFLAHFWHTCIVTLLLKCVVWSVIRCCIDAKQSCALDSTAVFSVSFGFVSSSIIRRCHYSPLPFASTLFLCSKFFVSRTVWQQIGMSAYAGRIYVAWIY
jgi:hypothetical protein